MKDLEGQLKKFHKDEAAARAKYSVFIVERVKLACRAAAMFKKAALVSSSAAVLALDLVQANSVVAAQKHVLESANEQLNEAKTRLAQISAQLEPAKKRARDCLEEAKKQTDGAPNPAMRQAFEKYPSDLDELQQLISDEQAKLDCLAPVQESVVREFERRQDEIATRKDEMATAQEKMDGAEQAIAALKEEWLPTLKGFISRIAETYSKYFRELDCASDVQLQEHESDFSKYACNILVTFRKGVKLQNLTGSTQSGGERSVATMFFLLALQSLSKVPFRVVDEINQGMDPNNERRVFSQVVRCSDETSSQYFLITPKLLPNLEFRGSLRVLCVFNGPQMVPDAKAWSIDNIIEAHQRKAARRY